MKRRQFGRAGWEVSEVGCGMWGMGSWSNSDDQQSLHSLQVAVDLGCNFFDTAYAYGQGRSESRGRRGFSGVKDVDLRERQRDSGPVVLAGAVGDQPRPGHRSGRAVLPHLLAHAIEGFSRLL